MKKLVATISLLSGLCGFFLVYIDSSLSQVPTSPPPVIAETPPITEVAAKMPVGDVPKGVEVQARGPVHEAFATPNAEPKPTPAVNKKPPTPIEELPPEEKPEGDAAWIGGYWAWDDDRTDYLWVSGCWRVKPADKEWAPGYWREQGNSWQWVPGFWTNAAVDARQQNVTYYPEPPAPPQVADPGDPPGPDQFYVPGYWMYSGDRYVWRAGYWTRIRPGYIYVPSHYRWTPYGHVFVSGYWDYTVARRGVLYAPITVDFVVAGPRFVYTPYYAVSDALVLDCLFVRPAYCHYYFGDYYGVHYHRLGFHAGIVYSRRYYDPVIVYQRWEYRDNPAWFNVQVNLVFARDSGRAWVPPRTLVQQNIVNQNVNVTNVTNVTNVNNVTNNNKTMLAPTRAVVAARGGRTTALDTQARQQVRESSNAVQQAVVQERKKTERPTGVQFDTGKPKTASLPLPTSAPKQGGISGAGFNDTNPKGGLKNPQNPSNPTNPATNVRPQPTDIGKSGGKNQGSQPPLGGGPSYGPTGNPLSKGGSGGSNPSTGGNGQGGNPNPVIRPTNPPRTSPPQPKRGTEDRKKK